MTRPWKHPKTGVYYFRKRVPADLRARIRREIHKVSLRTKDPEDAKRLCAAVAQAVEEDWDRLRANPEAVLPVETQLSDRQIHALCGEVYSGLIEEFGDNPGSSSTLAGKLKELQLSLPDDMQEEPKPRRMGRFGFFARDFAIRNFSGPVQQFLAQKGLHVSPPTRFRMCLPYVVALRFAYMELRKRAGGDYSDDPNRLRFPAPLELETAVAVTWEELYAGYILEAKPVPATQKRQKGILAALFAFLGHNDPVRVTKQDMVRWKEHCLQSKEPVTVRDADIAHPRAVFSWAVENVKMRVNPARDIKVRVPKKPKYRDRDFTDKEAQTILSWSLVPAGGRTSADRAAAIRWVPWLCAYTGARVNEITQARAKDVYQQDVPGHDPVWVIWITPEAGSTKTKEPRAVPLHPHLIEQGFLDYVRSRTGKCLFYDPSRFRGGSAGNPMFKKVGEALAGWVRVTCGVSDPHVQPNHGWRHSFRSACRAAKIETEIIDYLDGHAPASVGADYGTVQAHVGLERISRLPPHIVQPARKGTQIVGAPGGQGKRPRTHRGLGSADR